MYTKLADSILTSTVWMESDQTRIVWLTLLAMKDKNGEVQASIPGLANVARVTIEHCQEALNLFLSPDPFSRTKTDEGRRIEEIDGGWVVLNHDKYRDLASSDDTKRKAAERQRRYRDRLKRNGKSVTRDAETVTGCDKSRQIKHTDTDADADADKKEGKGGKPPGPPIPYSDILNAFNAAFNLKCRWTSNRKAQAKARWRDADWRDSWKEAIELGGQSAFLKGDNDRGWVIDFEFFLKPDTVTKIIEGKYDNREAPAKKPFKQRMQTPEEMANWTGKG